MQDLSLFTYKEAVNMILRFQTFLHGFWDYEVKDFPEFKRFIEMGYAERDKKHSDIYVATVKGKELIHEYIKNISESFINYMGKNDMEALSADVHRWFKESFKLEKDEMVNEIVDYICSILWHYGYKVDKGFSQRMGGNFYRLVACEKREDNC